MTITVSFLRSKTKLFDVIFLDIQLYNCFDFHIEPSPKKLEQINQFILAEKRFLKILNTFFQRVVCWTG